jgi:type I restriction enzyme S subunit
MIHRSWRKYRLGDLGKIVTGRTPSTSKPYYFGDKYPFITPSDMDGRKKADSTQRHLSDEGAKLLQRNLIPSGSVAVSCIGWQMGKSIMTCRPSFTNQQLNTIIPNEKVDADFLYYALSIRQRELLSLGAATGVRTPILNKSAFSDLHLLAPPLEVQRKIAAILSTYDDLIENNTRRIALLEEMARRLYQEWFVHFRFPGHKSVRMVDSPLGKMPEGWEISGLKDQIALDKGLSYQGKFLTDDGIPMVNLKCILPGGGFRRGGTKPYAGEYKPRHTVKPGDLFFANTDLTQDGNIIGSPAVVPPLATPGEIIISHHLYAVRFKEDTQITKYYLYHLMLADRFKSFAKGLASGTTVLGLHGDSVLQYQFVKPPSEILGIFDSLVAPFYELAETCEQKNENLRRTRDLLLPRLISRAVDVSDRDIAMDE